ncbi:MAG: prepilin-type N-terminal cleavage/methylation domain-containing protein [Candidatus Riflebacteria bacterium]|nr:prepilin-type N-terminal cleavage/methylation domain-containing protein [Candidatus Riflebacteria bacterium]
MSRKQGFTLLELLLVVAILAILAAAIGPSFYERGQVSMEYARKSKFINNYNALNLAANVILLASDTVASLSNAGAFDYINAGSGDTVGGFKYLITKNIIQVDTCQYENTKGEPRFFLMACTKLPSGVATVSFELTNSVTGTITPLTIVGTTKIIEEYLHDATGHSLSDLWELIKSQ